MAGPRSRLRLIALLSVAAWSVHQLRYALAFGSGQGDALGRTGHGYLELAGPVVGLLLLAGAAQVLSTVGHRRALPAGRGALPLRSLWLLLSGILLGVFCAQELLEGALSAGHPSGADALVLHGGWLAAPLALAAGLASALILHEAEAAGSATPVRLRGILRWLALPPAPAATPARVVRLRRRGTQQAGRGPPAACPAP
ncbi:hypothetical protein [Paraconexibacter sp. AEG42_29]|uniref:hypothetical protein n=1 Tax=Paraconexibacter sp. AEG42_29 TaxID=2997339 RepID=UPI00339D72C9